MPPTLLSFLAPTNRYSASGTVLTASSAVSALPVEATKNSDRNYVWRSSTATTVQTIDVDMQSVVSVSAFAAANTKLLGSGVLELYHRGDGGAPGAAVLVATLPAEDRDTRASVVFFTAQSHRHWQLKFTNPGSASDYAELGYAFLGVETECVENPVAPARIRRVDPSVSSESIDGQETYAVRTKYFVGSWDFSYVTEAHLSDLRELWDTLGSGTPMFMVLVSSLPWTCWFARWVGELAWDITELEDEYNVAFHWKEVR